jgi:predicted dehydrogenase
MSMTVEQADEMVKVVKRSGVKCLPFQTMYRSRNSGLKKRLDQGLIGDIVVMHSTGRWSIAEDWWRSGKAGWFADPKQVPGGAFIDEGIYGVDQLRWLAGAPVVEVSAKTANLVHKDIGVEDWGMATFTYANGVVATLEAGWTINSPKKTGPSPKQNATLRTEIVGTRGEVVQDSHVGGLAVLAAGAAGWVIEAPADEPYTPPGLGAMGQLLDCLDAGTDTIAGIEDAREGYVAAMAAYQSAREGRPVRLG